VQGDHCHLILSRKSEQLCNKGTAGLLLQRSKDRLVVPKRKVGRAPRRTFSRALLGQRARRRLHHAGLGAGRASLARSLGQARHKAVMARTKAHNRTAEQQAAWEAQEAADAREAAQEAAEAAARRARRGRRASSDPPAFDALIVLVLSAHKFPNACWKDALQQAKACMEKQTHACTHTHTPTPHTNTHTQRETHTHTYSNKYT